MLSHSYIVPVAAVLAATLAAQLSIASPALAVQGCIADWSEAGPIVRREGLVPMEHIGRLVREKQEAVVVNSALCTADGRYVYRLTVRAGQGRLKTLVVDARRPLAP